MSSRKAKLARNIGGALPEELPDVGTSRDSILMVERLLRSLLQSSIDKLKDPNDDTAVADLNRFFTHFYGPTITDSEVADFVKNFQTQPPKAVVGYPRSTAQFPCFAIILESDQETQDFLGEYAGMTTLGEGNVDMQEYVGAFYSSVYGVYIYAEHPDVCAYLYQFAKSVIHGGKAYLFSCGLH